MPNRDVPTEQLIERERAVLTKPGVLSIRPGWQISNGWLTGKRAVVVTVEHKRDVDPQDMLPREIDGVPVDVRQASRRKRKALVGELPAADIAAAPDRGGLPSLALENLIAPPPLEAAAVEVHQPPLPSLAYTAPTGVALTRVSGVIRVQAVASPDAGWSVLRPFLEATERSLTIGLYDFTSKHILDTLSASLAGKDLRLVLDHPAPNPTRDQTDEETVEDLSTALGASFTHAWALDRPDPFATAAIYPSAYHIKVAVRDHASVWLSSGNWNNSNQPDIDPVNVKADRPKARSRDRDWHVVIDSPELAAQFEAYIQHDLDVASDHNAVPPAAPAELAALAAAAWVAVPAVKTPPLKSFFAPIDASDQVMITPLLTPDPGVYVQAVAALIRSAQRTLLMQFQYINLPATETVSNEAFWDLVAAVVERQKAGVDVRIIMSEFETADYLEELESADIDVVTRVKLQNNVHNKGIVVDGERVLVSSQNWSEAGTLHNRDAGVIIDSPAIASYFAQIFEHDWAHLSKQKVADS